MGSGNFSGLGDPQKWIETSDDNLGKGEISHRGASSGMWVLSVLWWDSIMVGQ